jgi:hypothetical protein
MNRCLLTGKISSTIKYKYQDKTKEFNRDPSYAYFDFLIDGDDTKVLAIITGINKIARLKTFKQGMELFIEGSLDFKNEIKNQRLPFEQADVVIQLKTYFPVIMVDMFKVLTGLPDISEKDILVLADEIK